MVQVSIITGLIYLGVVVISSLLVGILPPFVNRPYCEQIGENSKISKLISLNSSSKHTNKDLKYVNNYYYKKYKVQKSEIYPDCPEVIRPTQGDPWLNTRLTKNVIPIHYDIEVYVPNFDQLEFNGFTTITIEIVENSTDTFIVHNRNNALEVFSIKDKDDNDIEIKCAVDYKKNDYYVFKTTSPVDRMLSPLKIEYYVTGKMNSYQSGIFQTDLENPKTNMVITKFEPLGARSTFPCFDEPSFKATYNISFDHEANTTALSNMPILNDVVISDEGEAIQTIFQKTPRLPTYLIAFTIFKQSLFSFIETKTNSTKTTIRFWGRNEIVEKGYLNDSLILAKEIIDSFLNIFKDVDEAMPQILDLVACPIYPTDGIPHHGLIIFQENKVSLKSKTESERDKQRVALLMAKNFAELWFGNYVTFGWWNELWLQELTLLSKGDFFKYKALEMAFPEWNIYEQFTTEELIYVLVDDAYPSSHPVIKDIDSPYEIEGYFDNIESSKATAILRMIEDEFTEKDFLKAIILYLESYGGSTGNIDFVWKELGKFPNSPWTVEEFINRWFLQSNYPMITVRIVGCNNGNYCLDFTQERALNSNSSIFIGDTPYPSSYNWTWFIPIECTIGQDTNSNKSFSQKFYLDKKDEILQIFLSFGSFGDYPWVYCNQKFAGYFGLKYVNSNWDHLGDILLNNFKLLKPLDRSNLLHNFFVDAYSDRNNYTTYNRLAMFLKYLEIENDYLPWRTVFKHLNDMIDILEFKQPFEQVSRYFRKLINKNLLSNELWSSGGNHLEELLKETILELTCRLQHYECLNKVNELWNLNALDLINDSFNNSVVPSYARRIIYNYHMQNTQNFDDWFFLLSSYEASRDIRVLEAVTYTRQPWLLKIFIESQNDIKLNLFDFFDVVKYLSQNDIGREIIWDYIRLNYVSILDDYGYDDPRLGQMLIDISNSFESDLLYYELLVFIVSTDAGASINARFRSLEKVDTNVKWLKNKQAQIIAGFDPKNF